MSDVVAAPDEQHRQSHRAAVGRQRRRRRQTVPGQEEAAELLDQRRRRRTQVDGHEAVVAEPTPHQLTERRRSVRRQIGQAQSSTEQTSPDWVERSARVRVDEQDVGRVGRLVEEADQQERVVPVGHRVVEVGVFVPGDGDREP